MCSCDFIALDIESTGLSPYKDNLIEIGALKIAGGEIVDSFSSLVRYEFALRPHIAELTGITDEELKAAPSEKTVMDSFMNFCGDAKVILGHNVPFDYGFLHVAAGRNGYVFEPEIIDTLEIARRFHPELPSRKLSDMCLHYGISSDEWHRALADTVATYRLFVALKEKFGESDPSAFSSKPYSFVKKCQDPITPRQKKYLLDLLKYHKIDSNVDIDNLTKSEASRMVDKIILNYGRIVR